MAVSRYSELKAHVGHDLECVGYGDPVNPENVAVECLDCGEVIIDFDYDDGVKRFSAAQRKVLKEMRDIAPTLYPLK
jgi:hypothetical protein